MRVTHLLSIAFVSTLLMASCKTPSNVSYFQDVYTGTVITPATVKEIKVEPEDKLSIVVSTQDPALSSLFNLVTTQNRIGSMSGVSTIGNSASSGGSGNVAYYTVDKEGYIDFPVLGKLEIAGMTRFQIAEYIKEKLQKADLVKDPIVTVEFVNTGISIIGEVGSPGRKEFNRDQLTIIDAIAMAGDLKLNGDRENILVLRSDENGKQTAYRVNLLDLNTLAQSPVYYIQQDDVIYVQPNDKTKRDTTPNGNTPYTPSFWISLMSAAITVTTLIITLSK